MKSRRLVVIMQRLSSISDFETFVTVWRLIVAKNIRIVTETYRVKLIFNIKRRFWSKSLQNEDLS